MSTFAVVLVCSCQFEDYVLEEQVTKKMLLEIIVTLNHQTQTVQIDSSVGNINSGLSDGRIQSRDCDK